MKKIFFFPFILFSVFVSAQDHLSASRAVVNAGGRGRGRLRFRLGLAFFQVLSRTLQSLAPAGARRAQAQHVDVANRRRHLNRKSTRRRSIYCAASWVMRASE